MEENNVIWRMTMIMMIMLRIKTMIMMMIMTRIMMIIITLAPSVIVSLVCLWVFRPIDEDAKDL